MKSASASAGDKLKTETNVKASNGINKYWVPSPKFFFQLYI